MFRITNDHNTVVLVANVLYKDVSSSMGEGYQKDDKEKVFNGFTFDRDIFSKAFILWTYIFKFKISK